MRKSAIIKGMALILLVVFFLCPSAVFGDSPEETIDIQINGETVYFDDALAQVTDGRAMVPMRGILEALGANVDYNEVTRAVSFSKGSTSGYFVVGGAQCSVTRNGFVQVMEFEVSPYIQAETGRVYVPARFIAEALGYEVEWDSMEKVVIIIDLYEILRDVDRDFSILSSLFESDEGAEGTMRTYGTSATYRYTADGELESAAIMDIEKLTEKGNSQIETSLFSYGTTEAGNITDTTVKVNRESGLAYVYSPEINHMLGVPQDVWISVDSDEIYHIIGIPLREEGDLSEEMTEWMMTILSEGNYKSSEKYGVLNEFYRQVVDALGDEAFVFEDGAWMLELDEYKIMDNILLTGEIRIWEGENSAAEFEAKLDITTAERKMHIEGVQSAEEIYLMEDTKIDGVLFETSETKLFFEESDEKVDYELPDGAEILDYRVID